MSFSLTSEIEGLSTLAAAADEQIEHPIDSADEQKQSNKPKQTRPEHYHSLSDVDRERIVALHLNGDTVKKISNYIKDSKNYNIFNIANVKKRELNYKKTERRFEKNISRGRSKSISRNTK